MSHQSGQRFGLKVDNTLKLNRVFSVVCCELFNFSNADAKKYMRELIGQMMRGQIGTDTTKTQQLGVNHFSSFIELYFVYFYFDRHKIDHNHINR